MRQEILTAGRGFRVVRQLLRPGEATPWHVDSAPRFTIVLSGEGLRIEFADGSGALEVATSPGTSGWDEPELRRHRAVNIGAGDYDEVVIHSEA